MALFYALLIMDDEIFLKLVDDVRKTIAPQKEYAGLTSLVGGATDASRAAADAAAAARAAVDAAQAALDAARAAGKSADEITQLEASLARATGDLTAAERNIPLNPGEELRNGVPVKIDDNSVAGPSGNRLGFGNRDPKVTEAGINPTENPNNPIEPVRKDPEAWKTKLKAAGLVTVALIPIGILLAAITQGLMQCDAINGNNVAGPAHKDPIADRKIIKVESAATPKWPDWVPNFVKKIQTQKTYINITYKDAIHILNTDKIDIKNSNVFDKNGYEIKDNSSDDKVMIDIGKPWEDKFANVANVATFTLHTTCDDRVAYMAGKNFAVFGKAVTEGVWGIGEGLGVFAEAIPWKSILIGLAIFALVYFIFQTVSVFRS